ncbi:MAG: NAD(P)H-binding protein [Opitutaceae bacterium]|nr:NAD(P)H-binding protein [Opitutaceae bacterium]
MANKRLAIFGCGYVGTTVAREARQAGLQVTALTRNPARAAELVDIGVNSIVDDLAADTWHERITPGVDLVLNCVSSGGRGLTGYRRSYVEGMRSILAWAQRGTAGTMIYTSSTSVYPQDGGGTVDETAATDGAGETGRILLEAEALLRAGREARGRWFILRLGGIYGPGRHHLLDQVRAGVTEITGGGAHHLNLVHRDDIGAAVFAAFAAPASVPDGIFNVVDDAPAPKSEVVGWLAERLGRPPPRFAGGAASAQRGFASPPDRLISNARLKAQLGWRPQYPSFREGYAALLSA